MIVVVREAPLKQRVESKGGGGSYNCAVSAWRIPCAAVSAAAKRVLCLAAGCTPKQAAAVESFLLLCARAPPSSPTTAAAGADGGGEGEFCPAIPDFGAAVFDEYAKDVSAVAAMLVNPAGAGVEKMVPSQEVALQLLTLAPVNHQVLLRWGLAGAAKNLRHMLGDGSAPKQAKPLRVSKALDAAWGLLDAAAAAHVTATVEVHDDVAAVGLVLNVRCEGHWGAITLKRGG